MNRDEQQFNEILDVVMRNALIMNADSYFADIPTEEEIMQSHRFSPEFLKNMKSILEENQPAKQEWPDIIKMEASQSSEQMDQSFWEEWKQQSAGTPLSDGSVSPAKPEIQRRGKAGAAGISGKKIRRKGWKLRWPARVAIALIAVGIIGSIGLSDNGFLRASLTQNVVEYQGQGTLITRMKEDDYGLLFKRPTYIPEGYDFVSEYESDYMKVLKYSDGTNELRISYIILGNGIDSSFDNERHLLPDKETFYIKKKYEARLSISIESDAFTALSWQNGLVQYEISSNEPADTLIKIAESIVP